VAADKKAGIKPPTGSGTKPPTTIKPKEEVKKDKPTIGSVGATTAIKKDDKPKDTDVKKKPSTANLPASLTSGPKVMKGKKKNEEEKKADETEADQTTATTTTEQQETKQEIKKPNL
jgi:hypothetical protein